MGSAAPLSTPTATLLALALIGLLPFAFMALTSFVKIATVLQIVRSALGAPGVPSNVIVLALGAALTLISMAPVGTRIAEGLGPLLERPDQGSADWLSGAQGAVVGPMLEFLSDNASQKEKERFAALVRRSERQIGPSGGGLGGVAEPGDSPPPSAAAPAPSGERAPDFRVVVPAFVVSQLMQAFSLGFAIYVPFLVLDLVVANILLGLGMQMLSPTQVSLPFKLLLFVATDGWGLLAESLVSGYRF